MAQRCGPGVMCQIESAPKGEEVEGLVKEFAAVVDGDGEEGVEGVFAHVLPEAKGDDGLRDVFEFADEVATGLPLDEDECAAFPGATGADTIHFPVAEDRAGVDLLGALLDTAALGEDTAFGEGVAAPFPFARTISQMTVG